MSTVADFLADTGPAPHPAATPEQQALLNWAHANPTGRPEAKRNGKRQYLLPHPETGVEQAWTRCTTYIDAIDDASGLHRWRSGLIVTGMAANADLADRVRTATAPKELYAIADVAARHGGDMLKADIGTALHTATEHADLGSDAWPPAPYDADIIAYLTTREAHGITCPPEWVERIAITAELGVAGTIDRIVHHDGRLRIADVKTGKIGYASQAAQLAVYAHATHLRGIASDTWEPMPAVDLETALIFHMPAGTGVCTVVEVDIARGWEVAQLCGTVRAARSVRGIFTPLEAPAVDARADWLAGRVRTIRDCGDPRGIDGLRRYWPHDVPIVKEAWTPAHMDAIAAVLDQLEAIDAVPFPPLDPTVPTPSDEAHAARKAKRAEVDAAIAANPLQRPVTDDGTPVNMATRDALKAQVAELTPAQKATAYEWDQQGRRGGRTWTFTDGATMRIAAINAAAFACAVHLDDDATRCAIQAATGDELDPRWPTGALLGALTTDQAHAVHAYATAVGDGDSATIADLAARLVGLTEATK